MHPRSNAWIYLILVVAVAAVYSNSIHAEFVSWDDHGFVRDNRHITGGLNISDAKWAFTTALSGNWIPLTWLSYMLDHEITASVVAPDPLEPKESPTVYHLTNIVLHTANVLLLFCVLNLMTGSRWRSALVALLFAVHPLHVENVAWISDRKDLLSTLFAFLALWAYARYVGKPSRTGYGKVLIAFAAAIMAKSMAITLPVLMLLIDFWPLKRVKGWTGDKRKPGKAVVELLREKAGLFVLSGACAVITVVAQRSAGTVKTFEQFPIGERAANAVVSYVIYAWKTIWPTRMAFYYPHPGGSLALWTVLGSGLVLAAVTVASIRAGRSRPYLMVGWLWFLITLVPVIGIVQLSSQAMADRYTYIPIIGLFVMLVWGVGDLVSRSRRMVVSSAWVCAAAAVVALAVAARIQASYWNDDLALYGHGAAVTEANPLAHDFYAHALIQAGQLDEAASELRTALRYDHDAPALYNKLGSILYAQGDAERDPAKIREAIDSLRASLRLSPNQARARSSLGNILLSERNFGEGIAQLREAHRLAPDDRKIEESLRQWETALRKAGALP